MSISLLFWHDLVLSSVCMFTTIEPLDLCHYWFKGFCQETKDLRPHFHFPGADEPARQLRDQSPTFPEIPHFPFGTRPDYPRAGGPERDARVVAPFPATSVSQFYVR